MLTSKHHNRAPVARRPESRLCRRSGRIFGPVPSRRLGRSLGVDLVPAKSCTYNCIYCESGRTTNLTVERFSPYSPREIIEELEDFLAHSPEPPEIVTLSGAGEPTLFAGMGELIQQIRHLSSLPVAVITNGSLFYRQDVRRELAEADLVLPSLDTAVPMTFRRLNRPHPAIDLAEVIAGLRQFRQLFSGPIWLEILLVSGINDTRRELQALQRVIEELRPNRVQLNTVDRPPQLDWVKPVPASKLKAAAALLGDSAEVISRFARPAPARPASADLAQRLLATLRRRPCTEEQISAALGAEPAEVSELLDSMISTGQIGRKCHQGEYFYTAL